MSLRLAVTLATAEPASTWFRELAWLTEIFGHADVDLWASRVRYDLSRASAERHWERVLADLRASDVPHVATRAAPCGAVAVRIMAGSPLYLSGYGIGCKPCGCYGPGHARGCLMEQREPAPFSIVQDTREQLPYDFSGLARVEVRKLPAGDYSIAGLEDVFAIERKSLEDAYGTFGHGRERFIRELERLRGYEYAAIVVESSLRGCFARPERVERVTPQTVINSLLSWEIEYGVHVCFAGDRELARNWVFRACEKFWRKKQRQREQGGAA